MFCPPHSLVVQMGGLSCLQPPQPVVQALEPSLERSEFEAWVPPPVTISGGGHIVKTYRQYICAPRRDLLLRHYPTHGSSMRGALAERVNIRGHMRQQALRAWKSG